MKKILLFLIPFVIVSTIVVIYFKLSQKISEIKIPNLPPISLSDFIKFSRFSLEKAPSQSLTGTVTYLSGDVGYEKRTATESAKITNPPDEVQQGESFSTGTDGKVSLKFDNAAQVDLDNDTQVNIIQTLPKDLVFSQISGNAVYQKLSDIPVTIRVLHLLVENGGKIQIEVDKIRPIITVKITEGTATVAYNNSQNISQIQNILPGKTLTFNDRTRIMVVENN